MIYNFFLQNFVSTPFFQSVLPLLQSVACDIRSISTLPDIGLFFFVNTSVCASHKNRSLHLYNAHLTARIPGTFLIFLPTSLIYHIILFIQQFYERIFYIYLHFYEGIFRILLHFYEGIIFLPL